MKKLMLIMVSVCGLAGFLAEFAWAETMYAKSGGVKVTVEQSPTSKVVATLDLGDEVNVVEKAGRQYQVKLPNGKVGWVFKFKLTDEKPASSGGGGSGLSALTGKSTITAKEARAGGSIRGLKETTEQYAKRKQISQADRQSVEKMEQLNIPSDELTRFKREGGIGEFEGGAQ